VGVIPLGFKGYGRKQGLKGQPQAGTSSNSIENGIARLVHSPTERALGESESARE